LRGRQYADCNKLHVFDVIIIFAEKSADRMLWMVMNAGGVKGVQNEPQYRLQQTASDSLRGRRIALAVFNP
jgi:hypothetical protein